MQNNFQSAHQAPDTVTGTQFRGADHSGVLHFTSGGADDRRISRGEEFQNQGLNSYN
ncbi:MAG: hypothetical protein EZS28_056140, partial [Streblomastix strix]